MISKLVTSFSYEKVSFFVVTVNVRVPSMLQYSSLKQLKHYIELVQKVQYLQVQLHLMDYVHSDLLCDYTLDNTTNPSRSVNMPNIVVH